MRPLDGRLAVFVAGSEALHRFVASRLSNRSDIWVARPLSARDRARGTAYRMQPDVTVVDLDTVWNPAGLPLARAMTEASPDAHVVLVAPELFPHGEQVAAASQKFGWSAIRRRRNDAGERLLKAISEGLEGKSWIDPALTEVSVPVAQDDPEKTAAEEKRRKSEEHAVAHLMAGKKSGTDPTAGMTAAEIAEWKKRARKGMRT